MGSAAFPVVEFGPVEVLALAAEGGLAGASDAFARLEARLVSAKGRRFYGLLDESTDPWTYAAAVARLEADDARALGLEPRTIPAGRWARTTLSGWRARPQAIGEAFVAMTKAHAFDPARASVEWYRSADEVVLLLPVR